MRKKIWDCTDLSAACFNVGMIFGISFADLSNKYFWPGVAPGSMTVCMLFMLIAFYAASSPLLRVRPQADEVLTLVSGLSGAAGTFLVLYQINSSSYIP